GIPLDEALLQETVVMLGIVPVVPYTCPGSSELAEKVAPFCRDYNAALLEHHGAVTWAGSVMEAYYRLERVEYYAKLMMYSRMMNITRPLTEGQIDELMTLRSAWNVSKGGRPRGRE
ncbi:MAG: class II aldolase/adducin family protein, partial [Oscillospiraceae bacterium]|nr:class II aldolase/adducin family protein [Oscillospiraceae bacterium]